jgi:hypothetical protein
LQLHNEYVDLKPDRAEKIGIMMVALLSKRFERFGGTGTHVVVQGGGLRLVHVSPICKLSKTVPVSLT